MDAASDGKHHHEEAKIAAASRASGTSEPFIVGIGASAGGLEALERLFKSLPDQSGMAFVVIQHLSPDFRSLMDELLARHTRMTIHRVTDGMPVEPDSIYLIPPRKEMVIAAGRLLLTDKAPARDLSLPIDHFFRSLAQDAAERAIAIVLSGTGSDGSRGIREVHEAGGLVIVQTPESAQFDGMPRSAADTGVADALLAPEEMPGEILAHAARATGTSTTPAAAAPGSVEAIFKLLRAEYGIDFSYYKPNTVGRRIERRQALSQSEDVESYLERVRRDPAELNALYRDLLIGVTRFFRDRDAFERLERDVLPDILTRRPAEEELRIWVAGCATGEEAYSLAILLDERFRLLNRRPNVKIFASDAHRASLEVAGAGVYDEDKLADVTPSRLERYFVKRPDGYHVTSELRQMLVFAVHDVIKDAPFTKLDLITCRNLLIYFQQPVQRKVLSLFHFGLRTGGILFLGPSESPGELAAEFEDVDAHWKIYRKRRDVRLPADMRLPLTTPPQIRLPAPTPAATGLDGATLGTYDRLLERYMPPGVLVTERRLLVHSFGDVARCLTIPRGRTTTDILDLVRPELRVALAGALQRAVKDRTAIVHPPVRVDLGDGAGEVPVKMTVEPILNRQAHLTNFFIALETVDLPLPSPQPPTEMAAEHASGALVTSLEAELHHTRENLQATVEELETSNEEMQASNEELVASNEELQSTNEELHSVNEELYTVNAEYQKKIQELTELTDDMDNLLRSTDIGTIFLDRDLCIRKFTPQIARAFDLLPQDVGRRIDSFSHNIRYAELIASLERVLDTGERLEIDVQDQHGNWFFLRVLPYRSHAELAGVVLSLIDISPLKRAETRLAELSAIVESSDDAIIGLDLDGTITTWNQGARRLFGHSPDEIVGQPSSVLHVDGDSAAHQPDWTPEAMARMRAGLAAGYQVETVRRRSDGTTLDVLIGCSAIRDARGTLIGMSLIASDIGALKEAERRSRRSAEDLERINRELLESVTRREAAEAEARAAVERRDRFLAILSHELRNPLAAVLNAAHLLERAGSNERIREQAQGAIGRQSRQMARLLDDLLDVSRIARNKIEIKRELVDIGGIAREASELVRTLVETRRQRLTIDLSPEAVMIEGDPTRIQQIVVNLLNNAVKYTPEGGEVRLTVQRDREDAVLRVRDTGPGIPPPMRERIFELFFQLDSAVGNSDGGMGVGLTLVRSLVGLHGGTVHVEEAPAGGAEFVVRIPVAVMRRDEGATRISDHVLAGLRVLVVEDNDDIRITTVGLLEDLGCAVTDAPDGASGVGAATRDEPEVALVDISMPGMDGYEVARRIRATSDGHAPLLIALTGFGQEEDRARALAAGFDAHLVKPIDLDQLAATIDRLRR